MNNSELTKQLDWYSNSRKLEEACDSPLITKSEIQGKLSTWLDDNKEYFKAKDAKLLLKIDRNWRKISPDDQKDFLTQRINCIVFASLISKKHSPLNPENLIAWTGKQQLSHKDFLKILDFVKKIPPEERTEFFDLVKPFIGNRKFVDYILPVLERILAIPVSERAEVVDIALKHLKEEQLLTIGSLYKIIKWIPCERRKEAVSNLWSLFYHSICQSLSFVSYDSKWALEKMEALSLVEREQGLDYLYSFYKDNMNDWMGTKLVEGWLALPEGKRLIYLNKAMPLIEKAFHAGGIQAILRGVALFELEAIPKVVELMKPLIESVNYESLFGYFSLLSATSPKRWQEVLEVVEDNFSDSVMVCDQVNEVISKSGCKLILPKDEKINPKDLKKAWCDFCRQALVNIEYKDYALLPSELLLRKMKSFEIDESEPLIHDAIIRLTDRWPRYPSFIPHMLYKQQYLFSQKPFPTMTLEAMEVCGETVSLVPKAFEKMSAKDEVENIILTIIDKETSKDSEFVIGFAENNKMDPADVSLFLKNIIGPKVELDRHVKIVFGIERWNEKLTKNAEEGFKEFFEYLSPNRLVSLFQKEVTFNLIKDEDLKMTWDDNGLTEYGALKILQVRGFLK